MFSTCWRRLAFGSGMPLGAAGEAWATFGGMEVPAATGGGFGAAAGAAGGAGGGGAGGAGEADGPVTAGGVGLVGDVLPGCGLFRSCGGPDDPEPGDDPAGGGGAPAPGRGCTGKLTGYCAP